MPSWYSPIRDEIVEHGTYLKIPSEVIVLSGGQTFTARGDEPEGDPWLPDLRLDLEDIGRKFRAFTSTVLPEESADRAVEVYLPLRRQNVPCALLLSPCADRVLPQSAWMDSHVRSARPDCLRALRALASLSVGGFLKGSMKSININVDIDSRSAGPYVLSMTQITLTPRLANRNLRVVSALMAVASLVTVAACSSDPAKDGTVRISAIFDSTGANSFAGTEERKGFEAALKQIKKDGDLGSIKIDVSYGDTASDGKQAVSLVREAKSRRHSMVVYGGDSSVAKAFVPIAQSVGLPTIVIESGAPGIVEAGDEIVRVTPPQLSYQEATFKYLQAKGVKTLAIAYNSEADTTVQMGTKSWPDFAKKYGMTVTDTEAVTQAQGDYSSVATKLLRGKPDAVIQATFGTTAPGLAGKLIQNGFDGVGAGMTGFSGDALKSLGSKVDGWVFPTVFVPGSQVPSSQDFETKFKALDGGTAPNPYNGDGWDAAYLMVAALKKADKPADASSAHDGLLEAIKEPLDHAFGPITFKDRDAVIETPLLVEKKNGADVQYTGPGSK